MYNILKLKWVNIRGVLMDWKKEYRDALLDISENPPDVRKIVEPHIPLRLYKYGSFQSSYWEKVIYKL